jgi:hypothetical protein
VGSVKRHLGRADYISINSAGSNALRRRRLRSGDGPPISRLVYDLIYVFEDVQDQAVVQAERPTSRRKRRPELYGKPKAELALVGDAYYNAARRLLEAFGADRAYSDLDAYPIVFLCRHALELLKVAHKGCPNYRERPRWSP